MTRHRQFVAIASALVAMALLGLLLRWSPGLRGIDADIVVGVSGHRSRTLLDAARFITNFGALPALVPIAVAATILFALGRRGGLNIAAGPSTRRLPAARGGTPRSSIRIVAAPLLALALAAALDPLAKVIFQRPRPPAELADVVLHSSGYPSGHSAQSSALFLAIAFVWLARTPRTRRNGRAHRGVVLAIAILATLLVGLSRVVLGVHSPTDLIGGWLLGTACALAAAPRPALAGAPRPALDDGP